MQLKGADERIIEGPTGGVTPARVLRVVLIGCAVGAVFGSGPLLAWTQALPDSRAATMLQDAAAKWNDAMSPLGTPLVHARLRAALRALEAWRSTK